MIRRSDWTSPDSAAWASVSSRRPSSSWPRRSRSWPRSRDSPSRVSALDGAVVQLGGHAAALALGHRQDLVDQPARGPPGPWPRRPAAGTGPARPARAGPGTGAWPRPPRPATRPWSGPGRRWPRCSSRPRWCAAPPSAAGSLGRPGCGRPGWRPPGRRRPAAGAWCRGRPASRRRPPGPGSRPGRRGAGRPARPGRRSSSWRTAAARRAAASSGAPLEVVLESRAACSYARASSRNDSRSARSRRATSPPTRVAPVKETIAMTTSAAASVHRDGPLARPRRLVPARVTPPPSASGAPP